MWNQLKTVLFLGSLTALAVAAAPAPATASLFIVNPLAGATWLTALLSTHPPMQQRIARLLQMARPLRAA
jgi:heat shock protein HtpX